MTLAVILAACGGDDTGAPAPGTAGGGSGGAPAAGGSSGSSGAGGRGGSAGAAGSASDACATIGGTLAGSGACYVPCVYDGSLVPTYDRNGDCTKFGSKCGNFNYCLPNITCTADPNCGTGRACGLGGQCLIACAADTDCPSSVATPLSCKSVDTGSLVCRP
jgi:hypothetical protein